MTLEDLTIYKLAMAIGQEVWDIVNKWDSFPKYTLGKQWVDAADSIAQNISEGFGRYHYRDAKNFYYFSRGSLFESLTILQKASTRNLVSNFDFESLKAKHKDIGIRLNNFIHKIGNQ